MTELDVQIGEVVLRGTPPSYAASFGALVKSRIAVLARDEELAPSGAQDAETVLADHVARQVWAEVRRATAGPRGERS